MPMRLKRLPESTGWTACFWSASKQQCSRNCAKWQFTFRIWCCRNSPNQSDKPVEASTAKTKPNWSIKLSSELGMTVRKHSTRNCRSFSSTVSAQRLSAIIQQQKHRLQEPMANWKLFRLVNTIFWWNKTNVMKTKLSLRPSSSFLITIQIYTYLIDIVLNKQKIIRIGKVCLLGMIWLLSLRGILKWDYSIIHLKKHLSLNEDIINKVKTKGKVINAS